jgi:hypothetical protein
MFAIELNNDDLHFPPALDGSRIELEARGMLFEWQRRRWCEQCGVAQPAAINDAPDGQP